MFSNDYQQLALFDQVSTLNNLSFEQPLKFLDLLKEHFHLASFIPNSFYNHYYSSLGTDRDYGLESMLSAFLIKNLLHIPTVSLLRIFIAFSPYIQDFCHFSSIPDESAFSRFKIVFEKDIHSLFDNMIPCILDICSSFDDMLPEGDPLKGLSSALIYDTSGLKPMVKENNPKTLSSEINRFKAFAKTINDKNFNPYGAAYKNMPKFSAANPDFKLDFVNGHFGYFYKFGMLTNGLGIPLSIHFFDDDFYSTLPSDFETPEDQKYCLDNASLRPVLSEFLASNKGQFRTFMGDSEFDSYDNFSFLRYEGFEKVFIPINQRNSAASHNMEIDCEGTPLCPLSKEPFKSDGSCKGKNRSLRLKYVCPKSVKKGKNFITTCETPCRDVKSTVTTYKYPDKDFRLYPGVQRNSEEWRTTYKKRTIIEREISSLKKDPSIERPRTLNTASMRSDLYFAAISKLIVVILAHAINKPEFMRNISAVMQAA